MRKTKKMTERVRQRKEQRYNSREERQYRERNTESVAKRKKQYYQKNKDKLAERRRQLRNEKKQKATDTEILDWKDYAKLSFFHQMVWTLLGLGEGILLDWWRDCRFGGGFCPRWFQYTAGMVSIHCGDAFNTLQGWFYPNSGMVLSQLWDGFIPSLGGLFPTQRMLIFEHRDAISWA